MKNIIKKLNIVILLAIIVVSFSGCTFIEKRKQEKIKAQVNDFETFVHTYAEEVSIDPVDTSNWQTYTDERYGFSFKYPQNWTLDQINDPPINKYKSCYDFNKIPWYSPERLIGGASCKDAYGGYDMKPFLGDQRVLCLRPNGIELHAWCYIEFDKRDVTLKNINSMWEIYSKNYVSAKDAKYMKYVIVNNRAIFTTDYSYESHYTFWNNNYDVFDIYHVTFKGGDAQQAFQGIIQTLQFH